MSHSVSDRERLSQFWALIDDALNARDLTTACRLNQEARNLTRLVWKTT